MPICENCNITFEGKSNAKTCGAKCRKALSRKAKSVTTAQPAKRHTSKKKTRLWHLVNRYDVEGDTIIIKHVRRYDSPYDYPMEQSPKTNPAIKFMRYPDGSLSEWQGNGWKQIERGDEEYWISGRGRILHQ